MNITYLIGAGASCAMAPGRVPGMQLFASLKTFFPEDTEKLTRLLVGAGLFKDFVGNSLMRPGSMIPSHIENQNVELILQELENVATDGGAPQAIAANEAHNLVKSLITRLFSRLEQDGVAKGENNPYDLLAAAIMADRHGHTHHFVSFNYDVWLEQALQRQGIWNPVNGYLINQTNPIRVHYTGGDSALQVLPTNEPSPTLVYKPHGSLSWLTSHDEPYGIPVLFLDQVGLTEGGKHTRGAPHYLPAGQDSTNLTVKDRGEVAYSPLIIPPVLNKAVGGEFLYKVHKSVQRLFEGAHAVVVIGWSMPASDASIRQRISDGLAPRNDTNIIKWLIACNLGKQELFYNRYRATIPAQRSAICNDGFAASFIEEYLKPLWANEEVIPAKRKLATSSGS